MFLGLAIAFRKPRLSVILLFSSQKRANIDLMASNLQCPERQ